MQTKSLLLYTGILLAPAALAAQGINISLGAQLVMSGKPQLVLNNAGFTNNGTFSSSSSTIWFTGNDATLAGFIGGSSNLSFYNVAIARQAGNVQLLQNMAITDSIRMSRGNLLLKSYGMNLLYSSTISGESEQSFITADSGGYIHLTKFPAQALTTYNPGNIGVDLTTTNNPAALIVYRRHVPAKLPNGKPGIKRVFNITSLGNAGSTTLRFHYLDAELPGISESTLKLYKGDTSAYTLAGRDSIDMVNNVVVTSGISIYGLGNFFTLGGEGIDQPILVNNPIAREAVVSTDTYEKISNKMQVYPVPAHDYFIVTVTSDRQRQSEFLLFDEAGHLLQRKKLFLLSGGNNISWDISSYPAGVYYITSDKGKMNKLKIIKQ